MSDGWVDGVLGKVPPHAEVVRLDTLRSPLSSWHRVKTFGTSTEESRKRRGSGVKANWKRPASVMLSSEATANAADTRTARKKNMKTKVH